MTTVNRTSTGPKCQDIFEAAQKNDEKLVKYFVEEKHVPVTSTNFLDMTAAHIAASNGKLSILKYLIDKDATLVEMKDRWRQTPLHMAVGRGAMDVVEYLVETCKANICQSSHVIHLNSVLHIAAEAGRLEVLRFFVEKKKMNVNKRNDIGQPPAFLAASHDHVHIIEYLLDRTNADVTMVDDEGRNILHMSVEKGTLGVPKFLLDQRNVSLDVNNVDSLGRSVVYSASRFLHENFIKYFVEQKHADVNLADNLGWTPLHQVAFLGNLKLVRYFLAHGADPSIEDTYGKTALDSSNDGNVTKCLSEAVRNRTRRSAPPLFEPFVLRNAHPLQKSVIGNRSTRLLDEFRYSDSSSTFQHLLMLAEVFIGLAKRSSMTGIRFGHSNSTPRRSLTDRIDPVAVDAVHSLSLGGFEN